MHRRARVAIVKKLKLLDTARRNAHPIPIVLLGGVYLDLHVQPILAKRFTGDEYTNIERVVAELGGSAILVGRYLKDAYEQGSHLVSVVSKSDEVFANETRRLLADEKWISDLSTIGSAALPPAITVLLHQADGKFNTMFTQTGVLNQLSWASAGGVVRSLLSEVGILYISGFFKTNLCNKLCENLAMLSTSLIVIDHGRLMPTIDNPIAVHSLEEAFKNKIIDVYICTYRELWDFLSFINHQPLSEPPVDRLQTLQEIAQQGVLPYVTFVRNQMIHRSSGEIYQTYCIIERIVSELRPGTAFGNSPSAIRPSSVLKNSFNAALLYALSTDRQQPDIDAYFVAAGQKALEKCISPR
jgi:hypothetical protein